MVHLNGSNRFAFAVCVLVVAVIVHGSAFGQQRISETIPAPPGLTSDCLEVQERQAHFNNATLELHQSQIAIEQCTRSGCSAQVVANLQANVDAGRRIARFAEVKLGVLSSTYVEYVDQLRTSQSPLMAFVLGEKFKFSSEDAGYYSDLQSTFPTYISEPIKRFVFVGEERTVGLPDVQVSIGPVHVFSETSARSFVSGGDTQLHVEPSKKDGLVWYLDRNESPSGILLYGVSGTLGEICGLALSANNELFKMVKVFGPSDRFPLSIAAEFTVALRPEMEERSNIELQKLAKPLIEALFSVSPHSVEAVNEITLRCSESNVDDGRKLFDAIGQVRGNLAAAASEQSWPTADQILAASNRTFTNARVLYRALVLDPNETYSDAGAMRLSIHFGGEWIGDIAFTRAYDQRQSRFRFGVIEVKGSTDGSYRCGR